MMYTGDGGEPLSPCENGPFECGSPFVKGWRPAVNSFTRSTTHGGAPDIESVSLISAFSALLMCLVTSFLTIRLSIENAFTSIACSVSGKAAGVGEGVEGVEDFPNSEANDVDSRDEVACDETERCTVRGGSGGLVVICGISGSVEVCEVRVNVGYVCENGENEMGGKGGKEARAEARVDGTSKASKGLEPGRREDRRVSVWL